MPLIQDYNKLFEYTDNIKKIILNGNIVWPTEKPASGPDYTEPFYSENTTDQTESVTFYRTANESPTFDIYYSLDKGNNWNFCGSTAESFTYRNTPHTKVWFCAETTRWALEGGYSPICIRDCKKVGGNIMSLLYGRNFVGQDTSFPSRSNYNFYNLFGGNTNLVDASELLLPATTLASYCYQNMFTGCTSLTQAPALPATTLAYSCYLNMFNGCTSLTQAPALPATTLATSCYRTMFNRCTSLTQAPALPATTLAYRCYSEMFRNCTSLTTAPVLPATILVSSCYAYMFQSCTSLNNVTCYATSKINQNSSTSYWLDDVSPTGTFTKAAGVTWPSGANGIPTGWTVDEV